MEWTKPYFEEITLGMEVTAYVNTDEQSPAAGQPPQRAEAAPAAAAQPEHAA